MERQITVVYVVATILWVSTFVLIAAGGVAGMMWGSDGFHMANVLMCSGLALSAAAATVSIRAMLCRQNRLLREAFEYGRDSSGSVRRVR